MKNKQYCWYAAKFALPQFQMLGILLMLWGVVLAFQVNPASIFILVPGLALATMRYGIQIDFSKKMHRSFLSLFGFKIGKWNKIPTIKYINVFPERLSQNVGAASISATYHYQKFKVGIVINKRNHLDAGLFENKEVALENAKKIAKAMNTKVLDYSGHYPEWISEIEN